MDSQHLRSLLEQLHGELSQGGPIDERSHELLRTVRDDIARVVTPSPTGVTVAPLPAGEGEQIKGRVQEAAGSFEESHPRLASTLGQIANALSNMGL